MLTKRQKQILDLIRKHIEKYGMPPTRAEIGKAFGFRSPNAAEEHLRALERKGAIEMIPGSSRGIRLTAPTGLPVVASVKPGSPILAEGNISTHHAIPPGMFRPKAQYLFKLNDMALKDAGMFEGDLLVVARSRKVEPGQLVVARVDDTVVARQFRQRGNIVTLQPKNARFKPIRVDTREQDFQIEGLGVGIIRSGTLL